MSSPASVHPSAVVAPDATLGAGVEVAAGAVIGAGATIGAGTTIAAYACVRPGTQVGEGCRVEEHVVLGKEPRLAAHSTASRAALDPLVLGDAVTVCCGAIVFAGSRLAAHVIVGDQALVRERATLGERTVLGRGSMVDNDVAIGSRVRIQSNVYVTAYSQLEDDVFLGPGAMTTNDDAMGRLAPGASMRGALLRRACRVGGGAVLVPGVEVGEEAFVAAGAVVTRDVPARAFVMGVPARVVREVGEDELIERWR
jgi:UDP-3-O-[3-hydroxymyristoyl] glucosamine N-acyltransferase